MERIGTQKLWSFLDGSSEAEEIVKGAEVRSGHGHFVRSFLDLATKVAELHFRNRDLVLLFRGQSVDYRNANEQTTLKPTIFRPRTKGTPKPQVLHQRFEMLKKAEGELSKRYEAQGFLGVNQLKRQRILRWSILQHYGVCLTPLLDVTSSLRIAASFASYGNMDQGFVFVLGVPNLSGAVTASSEAGFQIVRLASACPPTALRPHIQEGYLLGEYPEMADSDQKANYKSYEIDFGRRLVAKFRFNPTDFGNDENFPKVTPEALRPPKSKDPLFELTHNVKTSIEDL